MRRVLYSQRAPEFANGGLDKDMLVKYRNLQATTTKNLEFEKKLGVAEKLRLASPDLEIWRLLLV